MLLRLEEQRKYYLKYYGENGLYRDGYMEGSDVSASMDAAAPSEDKGGSENEAAGEYSETNVQVVGVDEADLVKTDGNLMFVLSGKDLVVLDAWPADQMHEMGRVTLKADISGFFRTETRVVALSYVNRQQFETQQTQEPEGPYYEYGYYRYEPMTLVTVIDVTTPEAPVIIDETLFEGTMLDSRRIANKLYLVQQDWGYIWNQGISYWPQEDLWGASDDVINQAFHALAQKNQEYIDALTLSDVLPSYFKLGTDGLINEASSASMTACTALYYPSAFSGTGLITAVTADITGETPVQGSSVLGDWGTLYVSTQALYVAATNWSWWWMWSEDDDQQPEILTQIHKFTFDQQSGVAVYQASGTAPGYVLNQFSMDEFEGKLRVATTRPDWGWWDDENKSESYVTVLEQQETLLAQVGQVGGLGAGETIQSVRFVGPQGYMVTFRQTDPLYVIDLSDATQPLVSGELKIPGFSSYIHPMDETHLLTIGRDGDEEGNTFGVSFQIFDVSDPANPTQVAKTTLGEDDGWESYMWSDAMWDHHAFVYFASKQMLAIPISGYDWSESGGSSYTNFLQLLHVDIETGVTPFGTISHSDLLGELPEPNNEYCWYDMSWILNDRVQVRRGVFMDDFIYSISRGAVKVHDLRDLPAGEINHVILQDNSDLPDYLEQYYGYCWDEEANY